MKLPTGTVELDAAALAAVNSGKDMAVSIEEVRNSSLTGAQKATLGNQAGTAMVIDVNVLVNGAKHSSFNGEKLTVSVPYTLKAGENAADLAVWFPADDGTLEPHTVTYKNGTSPPHICPRRRASRREPQPPLSVPARTAPAHRS